MVRAPARGSGFRATSWLLLDHVLSELAETQRSSRPSDAMLSAGRRGDEGRAASRDSSMQRAPFPVVSPPSSPAAGPLETAAAAHRWEEPGHSWDCHPTTDFSWEWDSRHTLHRGPQPALHQQDRSCSTGKRGGEAAAEPRPSPWQTGTTRLLTLAPALRGGLWLKGWSNSA